MSDPRNIRVVLQKLCACGAVIATQEMPNDFPWSDGVVYAQLRRRFELWVSRLPYGDDYSLPLLRIDRCERTKCGACLR